MTLATAIDALRAQPWLAVGVFLAAFVLLILLILAHRRLFQPHPEVTR